MKHLEKMVIGACEKINTHKHLLTNKTVYQDIVQNNNLGSRDLGILSANICSWINKWRMKTLTNNKTISDIINSSPENIDVELQRYKHALYRANKKNKILEKKLRSLENKLKNFKSEIVGDIKNMLP